jgi:putative ABC transport system permease protein
MPPTIATLHFRFAMQNLARSRARTVLLTLAAALGSGVVFGTLTVLSGIEESMISSLHRLGADLLVVPEATMVNLTAALLTVEPTSQTLDVHLADELARIPGVGRVAPQTLLRLPSFEGGHGETVDVIAFDPRRDFTVLPWLGPPPNRAPQRGEAILGGRRTERAGESVSLCGQSFPACGRLEITGVGPFDHAIFMTFETAAALVDACRQKTGAAPAFDPGRVSALLILLENGTTPERVRFAVAQKPGVKVVSGGSLFTSIRQGASALSGGVLILALAFLLSSLLLVALLFSAIIAERSRELGLLIALGSRSQSVVRMVLAEAVITTGLGGLLGVGFGAALLLAFRRSLGYRLEVLQVNFVWPTMGTTAVIAACCVLSAAAVGLLGAAVPAWRAGRRDPYDLIRGEAR